MTAPRFSCSVVTTADGFVALPGAARADEPSYLPSGGGVETSQRQVENRPNGALPTTGIGMFVVGYGGAIVTERRSTSVIVIPVTYGGGAGVGTVGRFRAEP